MIEEPDGKGGTKKTLRYFGNYHCCELDEAAAAAQKRKFLVVTLAADVLFVLGITRNIPGNRDGISAALGLLTGIPLFFLTLGSFHNLSRRQNLTENEYRESRLYIRYGALGAAFVAAATFIFQIISLALHYESGRAAEYTIAFVCMGLIAVAAGWLTAAEKHTPFTLVEGMGTGEEDAQNEQHPYTAPVSSTAEYHEGLRDYLKRKKSESGEEQDE